MTVEASVSDQPKPTPTPARAPRRRRWVSTLVWLALLAAGGATVIRDPTLVERGWERGLVLLRPPAPAAKPQPPRVVPVTAVEARTADVDLFLNGLGSVVAFNTVTVRSRVDGELVKVAFREGQTVAEGDLLAEIDPRPFEVQLRQAEGQLARNQAALEAAKLDLERYESLASQKQITAQQIDAQRALVRQSEAATQIDRGVIDNVRLQLDFCRITAPISGRMPARARRRSRSCWRMAASIRTRAVCSSPTSASTRAPDRSCCAPPCPTRRRPCCQACSCAYSLSRRWPLGPCWCHNRPSPEAPWVTRSG